MSSLQATLDALQDRILHDPATAAAAAGPAVAEGRPAAGTARLRVYADAYRLRLAGVLADDFPATAAALGPDRFAALASGYVRVRRSPQPSVRHYGAAFADWLAASPDAPPGAGELARFEWRMGEAFDARDADALDVDTIAALPAADWPALRLRLHPAVRLLETVRVACADGAPSLAAEDDPASWVLWRDADGDVHWRRVEPDETGMLWLAREGVSFEALCAALASTHGPDGPLRAASVLKRWLVDGLLDAATTHAARATA